MSRKISVYIFLIFLLCSVFFLWIVCGHVQSFFSVGELYYLGGPTGDVFSAVEMLWWLFIFTSVWAGCGAMIDMEARYLKLNVHRYGWIRRWWWRFLLKYYGMNLSYFILFGIILGIRVSLNTRLITVLFVMMLHSCFMITLMLWIFIFTKRMILALSVLLVAEAVSKTFILMGIEPVMMPLVWGMYGYSTELYSNGGFSWQVAAGVEIIFMALIFMLPLHRKMRTTIVW